RTSTQYCSDVLLYTFLILILLRSCWCILMYCDGLLFRDSGLRAKRYCPRSALIITWMVTARSFLAGRIPLARLDVLAHRGQGISHRSSKFHKAGSGTVHAGLGQPGQRHAEQLGDLRWVQQGIDFVRLCGGAHGPTSFRAWEVSMRLPQNKALLTAKFS